jgi:hypothetical protein
MTQIAKRDPLERYGVNDKVTPLNVRATTTTRRDPSSHQPIETTLTINEVYDACCLFERVGHGIDIAGVKKLLRDASDKEAAGASIDEIRAEYGERIIQMVDDIVRDARPALYGGDLRNKCVTLFTVDTGGLFE